MDFSKFDLSLENSQVLPKTQICKECDKPYKFSPFSVITYANHKKVVENLCDDCMMKLIYEGKEKNKKLVENIKRKDKEAIRGRKRLFLNSQKNEEK